MAKYKNYGLWVAVAALLLMVLQDIGLDFSPERYQTYVDSILGLLILLGIISNPSNGKGFKDNE